MIELRIALPNKPGKLGELSDAVTDNLIDVRSLAGIGCASPFLAMVVDRQEMLKSTLQRRELGFEEIPLLSISLLDSVG